MAEIITWTKNKKVLKTCVRSKEKTIPEDSSNLNKIISNPI